MQTDLPLSGKRTGKVRDIYQAQLTDGTEALAIIATDRISAFDVVMPNGVPGKGMILTQISRFWFDHFADRVKHHLVSTDPADLPALDDQQRTQLQGRVMIGHKCKVIPIECIVRGYLAGSGYKDYMKTGTVCGIELPGGLENGSRLETPLFTPSTKAETGHDENISFAQACQVVGEGLMRKLRDMSIDIYSQAREYAAERGIIIADTKFEFGLPLEGSSDEPILIDEVLTPDSSRFWPADQWQPGQEQPNFDKQYVRNHLQTLCDNGQWDKTPPAPALPDAVINNTLKRYRQAYEMLTGKAAPV
jgi:phosphoribosylaminoimidazole-succinocarboxamide synthase